MNLINSTPVVVLKCGLGALAIFRTLGRLGVPTYGVDMSGSSPAVRSRYCLKAYQAAYLDSEPLRYLDTLVEIAKRFSHKPLLIPTTDELAIFVADHSTQLQAYYDFARNDPALVRALASKQEMFALARKHGLPTPNTYLPRNFEDLQRLLEKLDYPVMLKGIMGNRLMQLQGCKMTLVSNPDELVEVYQRLEDPMAPNLLVQEYIPGGDDQVYIFNGYFNEASECLSGFTGFKIRQHPIHFGSASLGECRWLPEVEEMTCTFLKEIGYRGIVDIGYRFDHRDGRYKVLDINPRVGQAFRLFVADNGMDVIRAFYLDLTGQSVNAGRSCDGRRWMIEDNDLISSWHYYQEGSLRILPWLESFRGVREAAWFSWSDPLPFFAIIGRFLARTWNWAGKKIRVRRVFGESGQH